MPRFQKKLYIRQPFPDNYVADTFLQELRSNVNVKTPTYLQVVIGSTLVTQQLSSVALFVGIFVLLFVGSLDPQSLVAGSASLTLLGAAVWIVVGPGRIGVMEGVRIAKGGVLLFTLLLGLTPLIHTLTKDTSSDTIWALSSILFILNLLFHDYGSRLVTSIRFPDSFSINASMFASVLLASRLPTALHVFSFMSLAVEVFALFPILRRALRNISPASDVLMAILLTAASTGLFFSVSRLAVVLYVSSVSFITMICPYWLLVVQKYKNEIRGPWDEARPKLL
ncbi:phosphatidylinositol N-acetylglucosaminyltransferase subunit C [Zopfochytrium polystomum]|nr:phosphatidylinositol N-acetylglucosaminyltransferase subunit C [Zopfochytrium polystomum]